MHSFFVRLRLRVRRSRWLQGALTFVAAVACVATSQADWGIGAELPAERSPTPGKALQYHVEASHEPEVVVSVAEDSERMSAHAERRAALGASWNGHSGDIIVLPGERLESVAIGDACNGGCSCDPPDGAHVTVSPALPMPAWGVGDSKDVTLPSCTSPVMDMFVHYEAQGAAPLRFVLRNADNLSGAHVRASDAGPGLAQLHVSWDCSQRHSTTVTVAALKDGVCDGTPCTAPPSETIHVTSVDLQQGGR